MYDVWQDPDVVTAFGTLLAGSSTVVGVIVAWCGLKTWKKERDADFAKRYAGELFKYRRILHQIRRGYLTKSDIELLQDAEIPNQVTDKVRLLRWRFSREILEEVMVMQAEAELRWQGDAECAFRPIAEIESELAKDVLDLGILNRRLEENNTANHDKRMSDEQLTEWWNENEAELKRLTNKLNDGENEQDETRARIEEAFRPMKNLLSKKVR
ncbi:hypothetical protein [Aliiroseovarius crassostreae]|uniref:hypothetical protein n=1 Tax=Aliiroseovarius crassostreae TaxID=154981 RepID=UPI002208C2F2|nr:hypothetical protein [Aliiroseovarius crassostreae]UWP89518.1 hypothetical protein K3J57_02080 [Aliiroseovarius crassostreae]UWQ02162.1 hypothetical protein K3X44_02085 [Aliiroseovarius crassostreae]